MKGYFTLEKYIVGKNPDELERALGFSKGTLADGAEIYGFYNLPELDEFELRGYTHLPEGGDPAIEQFLRETKNAYSPYDTKVLGREKTMAEELKKMVRERVWEKTGRNRPVKVVPRRRGEYPIGTGIPQWKLIKDVAAFLIASLDPGERYLG